MSGYQHDTACRRACGATLQNNGADEDREYDVRRTTHDVRIQPRGQPGAERNREIQNRRAHQPASGYSWLGFAPQRGALATLRKPSSSTTSSKTQPAVT